jgi:LCP family protein required for cell wall assembly
VASDDGDAGARGQDNQPPHVGSGTPLPPELNPRGRRAGRRERRDAAAQQAAGTAARHTPDAVPNGQPPSAHGGHDVRRGAVIGLAALLTALSISIVATSGWAWWTYNDFKSNIRRVSAIGPAGKPTHDVDGKDQNLLVVGNDDRDTATNNELAQLGTTRDGGSYNTDTMMLMHLPADGTKATVISFPRDSYVAIPGHGMSKLNSAYPDGILDSHGSKAAGARLLVQTIENLTGLTIDHFVQVDLLGFYRISNAIGGVQVNLCAAQNETNSGIDLPKGVSTIKGKQALAFVRQRYGLPNGDLDRIKRQQYFLSAAFRKVSSAGTLLNPFKLKKLLKAVTSSLQLDTTLDPLKLAEQFQNLSAGNLIFKTIPTHGTQDTNDAGNVVVVHPAEVKQFAMQLVGGKTSSPFGSAKAVAPGSFTVDVLNGSSTDGAASRNAGALRQLGFKVGNVDTTSPSAATVIKYPAGMQSQAKTLAARISGVQAQQIDSVQRVTLVLGSDGLQVATRTTTTRAPANGANPTANDRTAVDTGACIN